MQADGDARASTSAPPLLAVAVLLALLCTALYVNTFAVERIGAVDRAVFASRALRWHELSVAQLRAALAMPRPAAAISHGLSFRF